MQGAKTKQSTTPLSPCSLFSIVEGQVDWAIIGGHLTIHKSRIRGSCSFMSPGIGCERTRSGWILGIESELGEMSSVQSLSRVWLFADPWTAAHWASLSITSSWSLLKLMSIESVMPSNHLILCHPLLLLPPIPPSIRVFYSESAPPIRWPKYWNFSFSISPSSEHPGLIPFRMDWLDLFAVQGTLKNLLQHHSSKSINSLALRFLHSPTLTSIHDYWKNCCLEYFTGKVISLLFNMLSRLVIAFLPRSKHLSISRLPSISTVILEPKKIKSVTVSTVSPSICMK